MLVEAFVKGASEKHNVEVVLVRDHHINPCIGCDSCFKRENNSCFQNDNMQLIYDKLLHADMLVVASPVYFYGISAQLKALIDRLHTPMRNRFAIRRAALLLVAGNTLPDLFDAILLQYRMILCYFNIEDLGHILVGGVREPGAISGHPALEKAYQLGRRM